MHNNRDVKLHTRTCMYYEQQSTFYNRPKNCVNNGLTIRRSVFSLIERIHDPSRTYVNALWFYIRL